MTALPLLAHSATETLTTLAFLSPTNRRFRVSFRVDYVEIDKSMCLLRFCDAMADRQVSLGKLIACGLQVFGDRVAYFLNRPLKPLVDETIQIAWNADIPPVKTAGSVAS